MEMLSLGMAESVKDGIVLIAKNFGANKKEATVGNIPYTTVAF